ncbi:LysE family translocator [Roseisalinus antarcticus]|uniref:Cysteine/O-acetylserine efflux protein n=1 Tax=Roseisalinus antarcticus TaxID=254357 RepID=A0A1Y5RKH5_9RHOB|nr:LysE family translocator [Roseisalinus antarcticus]SLN19637.1 Cysteine/O-acetylserine efflux protein [Roseisalinus antarcticus]
MTPDFFLPLLAFAIVSTASPGPNNIMLMASGAQFGVRRTLPHMAGIGVGVMTLIFVSGLGLARIFELAPFVHSALKILAMGFLLWLAWKIASAHAIADTPAPDARPLTFWQSAAFQWINPKAWAMALTAVTVYLPDRAVGSLALATLAFGMVAVPSTSLWTVAGRQLRRLLSNPVRFRVFNWTMAALLLGTLWPILRA